MMPNDQVEELGFKRLDNDNWLTADPIWRAFAMPPDGSTHEDAWINDIMQFSLAAGVPIEIRKLFEIARGALVYGLLFYPLLTLGTEQLMRVHEAATFLKCRALSAPSGETSKFDHQIKWLVKQGAISREGQRRWDAVRLLRNHASHPKDQTILDPNMALSMLEGTVELINGLFQ